MITFLNVLQPSAHFIYSNVRLSGLLYDGSVNAFLKPAFCVVVVFILNQLLALRVKFTGGNMLAF